VVNDRLRIGDAEREAAAHELGEHFALGRIDAEEHTERLEQIWGARTAADLAPAFRDLPRPTTSQQTTDPAMSRPARTPSVASERGRRLELPHLPFLFKLLAAVVLVWWGFHHPLFLLGAVVVYVVLVRRFTHRRRWHGRYSHGHYRSGWH
jgi:Flp pilus assembly protein TadB